MFRALSPYRLPAAASIDDIILRARAAQVDGLELTAGSGGMLDLEAPRSACDEVAAQVRTAGLRIAGVASRGDWSALPAAVGRPQGGISRPEGCPGTRPDF